ncbi:uncharacterized protein I303_104603 [Kwoniella dejecticola CBS 10117]|uniref:Uncharacterized protein n=1 Tax=Kwoniella dejecticola CBS 10117 TaxID=1296121 RepID=A0A1A6A4X9_9TREE|nr:uncharacterized protein I303_04419 [Kwoniella dejecticola CBS 10117]OBR85088.1 hypothetical protein I303_04419 [Kwoniella dejecticola CBS 10117]
MPPKSGNDPWNDEHTREIIRGMIRMILQNRPTFYTFPALEGVSANRGDRINAKIKQILKKLSEMYPGCEGFVEEEIKNMVKSRGTPSPKSKKTGKTIGTPPPKKRKVKDEADEEPEEED